MTTSSQIMNNSVALDAAPPSPYPVHEDPYNLMPSGVDPLGKDSIAVDSNHSCDIDTNDSNNKNAQHQQQQHQSPSSHDHGNDENENINNGNSSNRNYNNNNISKPGQHDVLLGRGGGTNNHSGNVKFRKLVNEHKMRYFACSKVEKPKVAREVVQLWRKMDPPGRFLARKDDTKRGPGSVKAADNVWYEVGDKKAREKASQCLRERTPDVLPYIKQLREQQDAITEQGVSMVHQQMQLQQQEAAAAAAHGHHPSGLYGDYMSNSAAAAADFARRSSMSGVPSGAAAGGVGGFGFAGGGRRSSLPSLPMGGGSEHHPRAQHPAFAGAMTAVAARRTSCPTVPQMQGGANGMGDYEDNNGYSNGGGGNQGASTMTEMEYQHSLMMMQQQMQYQQMQIERLQRERMMEQQKRHQPMFEGSPPSTAVPAFGNADAMMMEGHSLRSSSSSQPPSRPRRRGSRGPHQFGARMVDGAVYGDPNGAATYAAETEESHSEAGEEHHHQEAEAASDGDEHHHHDPLPITAGGDHDPLPTGLHNGSNHGQVQQQQQREQAAGSPISSSGDGAVGHQATTEQAQEDLAATTTRGGTGDNGGGRSRAPKRTHSSANRDSLIRNPSGPMRKAPDRTPSASLMALTGGQKQSPPAVSTPRGMAAAATGGFAGAGNAGGEEEGELTLEEYRQQLEQYISNRRVPVGAADGGGGGMLASGGLEDLGSGDDDAESDLEDDWEKEKEKAYRVQQEHARNRGVLRNASGCSLMSGHTKKSNSGLSVLSGLSNLSDMLGGCDKEDPANAAGGAIGREHKMNRSMSSNISLMSELTDLSQNVDTLSIYDD